MGKKLKQSVVVGLFMITVCAIPVSAAKKPYIKISSGTKVSVLAGKTKKIKAKTVRKKRKITYRSSKKSVASVTSKGVIKGKKYGSAVIYVKAKGMKTKKIKVSVKKPITGLTLSSAKVVTFSTIGKTSQIRASVKPSSKYVLSSKLSYKSSNAKVAAVDSKGKITAKGYGYARLTISTSSGAGKKVYQQYIDVYVNVPVTGVNANDINISAWESKDLKASVTPSNATNKTLSYQSSNPSVAVVSDEGIVTGITTGEAQITITSKANPLKFKKIKVTVTAGIYNWPSDKIGYEPWNGEKTVITIKDPSISAVEILFKDKKGTIYSFTVRGIKDKFKELVELQAPFKETRNGVTVSKNDKDHLRNVNFRIDDTGESYDVTVIESNYQMIFKQNLAPGGDLKVFFNVVK